MVNSLSNSVNDYTEKKKQSQKFNELMIGRVGYSKAQDIQSCAQVLNFISDKEFEKHRVWRMITCKDSFCPLCQWRKSRRDTMKIATIMEWIKLEHDKEFIMLTLTYKRVTASELSATIDKFQQAFNRMFNRKKIKDLSHGYVKKLEITYDPNEKITDEMYKKRKKYYDKHGLLVGMDNPSYDTYHVHYHTLVAVDKSYFDNSRLYMSRKQWLSYWRRAMKDETITQVDVRKVRSNRGYKDSGKADFGGAWEIAKYTAKSSEYLVNQDVFDTFRLALFRRRRIVYSGLFREGAELYDAGELDYLLERDDVEYYWLSQFEWHWSDEVYNKFEVRALTDEEKEEINSTTNGL